MGFSKDSDGFYTATPTAGWQDGYRTGAPAANVTMIIFVSNDTGSDATSPTEGSFANPYKTLAKAYSRTGGVGSVRNGSPDQILLATGETWTNQVGPYWFGAGLDEQNRMIFSSYDKTTNVSAPNNPPIPNPRTGPIARPIIKTPAGYNSGMQYVYQNTAIMGIEFYAYTRDTIANAANASNPDPGGGIQIFNDTYNLLIEDNLIHWFDVGITMDVAEPGNGPVWLRRNVICNCWGDKYGIGSGAVHPGFLIEENLVDTCGWDPIGDWGGSSLNHDWYFNGNNDLGGGNTFLSDLTFRGNITLNDLYQSNNRVGGTSDNNLWQIGGNGAEQHNPQNPAVANLVQNEVFIGGFLGGPTHQNSAATALDVLAQKGPDDHGGVYGVSIPGIQPPTIRNCIVTQGNGNAQCAIGIYSENGQGSNFVTVKECISYKFSANVAAATGANITWIDGGGNRGTNSQSQAASWGWPHPERTPETYIREVIGDGSTWADFSRRCRQQSRRNWNPLLMAESVNDYIREAFGKKFVGSAYAGGIITPPPPNLQLSPTTLPNGTVGIAYNQTITASGGTAPYTFTVTGALPAGLSFNSGAIIGTPTTAGTSSFTINATDSQNASGSQSYTVTIAASTTKGHHVHRTKTYPVKPQPH